MVCTRSQKQEMEINDTEAADEIESCLISWKISMVEHKIQCIKLEINRVIHDKFCWRCCGEDTSLKCSNCIRSFHQNCAPNAAKDDSKSNSWLCSVCVNLKEAENTSKKLELDMLPLLIEKALKNKTFNLLKHPLGRDSYPESYITESIVHPVDLSKIKQKIGTYTSFDHFLSDIQWIVHNCFILFLDNHHRMEIAKSLVDYMEEEIEIVKKCPECYNNAVKYPNDWFTVICSDPHIIVWAKKMGFNYWPAKLMSIDGQLINVRFFGDHKNMDVMSTNCFLYSETNPNRSRNTTVLYKSALKEVEVYIKNCRSKFGAYNHVDTKIPFNPALLDKYIVQVIPALANSKMVKGIKARIKASESSTLKTTSRPSSEDRVDRTDAAVKLNLKEISPKKNVLIALHRIDDKMPNAKRNGKEAMLGTPDGPCEKKAKVSQDPENIESKHTPMATSQSQTQSVQKQTNSNENSERNQSQSVENQPENTIVSSVETTLVEDPEKPLLNSTVIKWPENVKSDGDFGDVSCINGQSIEEPTSTATLEDTEWEQSFEKDLNDTVQAATYHMYSSIAKNLKTKFDVLKEKLHDVTIERDQIVLKAERTKQRTKDDHAKEMSDLNEKYTQIMLCVGFTFVHWIITFLSMYRYFLKEDGIFKENLRSMAIVSTFYMTYTILVIYGGSSIKAKGQTPMNPV
ncbi:uncharacterized protein LOC116350304 [Contarinia nasturtii]|uniref:uncharacterized protein LOC116350304 n=1 Tax=Contarinia nasturtii TaxID=265458 RepID=UPI0012D49949|nr:uncharacterized protein LOC116350304 [Contarinia nasturtii]